MALTTRAALLSPGTPSRLLCTVPAIVYLQYHTLRLNCLTGVLPVYFQICAATGLPK